MWGLVASLLIAGMGSPDYHTRNYATHGFAVMCANSLVPYKQERAALSHQSLEVRRRAWSVLREYYNHVVLEEDGSESIDYTVRTFRMAYEIPSEIDSWLVRMQSGTGWELMVSYWHPQTHIGGTFEAKFRRNKLRLEE